MGVVDNVKEVADLIKKMGDIELYRKIVHTEGEVIELTRQLRAAEERGGQQERMLAFKAKLTFKAPLYFAEGDSVPFCPRCWEADHRAIHLIYTPPTETTYAMYDCQQCSTTIIMNDARRQGDCVDATDWTE